MRCFWPSLLFIASVAVADEPVMVLAQTVAIQENVIGKERTRGSREEPTESGFSLVTLVVRSYFTGAGPQTIHVAVPQKEMDFLNDRRDSSKGARTVTGPPPLSGLVPNDLAIWNLQSAGLDETQHTERTAIWHAAVPGADYTIVPDNRWFPMLVSGWPNRRFQDTASPEVNETLPRNLKFTDYLAKMGLRIRLLPDNIGYPVEDRERQWHELSLVQRSAPLRDASDAEERRRWFRHEFLSRWVPYDEQDRLNQYAMRISWGETGLTDDFLRLYYQLGFSALALEDPCKGDPDHQLWLAENGEDAPLSDAFLALAKQKSLHPRALKAALARLELRKGEWQPVLLYVYAITEDPALDPSDDRTTDADRAVVAIDHLKRLLATGP